MMDGKMGWGDVVCDFAYLPLPSPFPFPSSSSCISPLRHTKAQHKLKLWSKASFPPSLSPPPWMARSIVQHKHKAAAVAVVITTSERQGRAGRGHEWIPSQVKEVTQTKQKGKERRGKERSNGGCKGEGEGALTELTDTRKMK